MTELTEPTEPAEPTEPTELAEPAERWETPEKVAAARERFEADLAWERPAAWGLLGAAGSVVRSSVRSNWLNAVVLATVVGHTRGTAAYGLGPAKIAAAIRLAEPAEACGELAHPNIAALRFLQAAGEGATVVFVAEEDFVGDAMDQPVAALLAEIRRGRQENPDGTTTLWRPIGPEELDLVRAAGFQAWPPRLADQPIFYPVLTEEYAATIARDWNVAASGSGFVTRFRVATDFARRYPTQVAGGSTRLELWVPAEELAEFNRHIVGEIEVVSEFSAAAEPPRTTPPPPR
jgi:hypothetical protein